MKDQPNPGSDEAIEAGCTCPVMDNARGRGMPRENDTLFWINQSCPLHGAAAHEKQP